MITDDKADSQTTKQQGYYASALHTTFNGLMESDFNAESFGIILQDLAEEPRHFYFWEVPQQFVIMMLKMGIERQLEILLDSCQRFKVNDTGDQGLFCR